MNASALVAMVVSVRAFFAAEGYDHAVVLGWKVDPRQDNQAAGGANRIAFDMRGAKRKPLPVRGGPGPRALANGHRARVLYAKQWSIPVSFWVADRSTPGDPENEEAQIEALTTMQEHLSQAIDAYAGVSHAWGDEDWSSPPVERAYGRVMRTTLLLEELVFDVENEVVVPTGRVARGDLT